MKKLIRRVVTKVIDNILGEDPTKFLLEEEALTIETPPAPIAKAPEEISNWVHCENPDYYRLLLPPSAGDPNKKEPALMATVMENKETGEVRVIPYAEVPLLLNVHATINPQNSQVEQKQWICPNLEEN